MPLLIDEPRWPAHGRLWSHLVSDTSFAELHAFADRVGLPPRSFEGDHYDVPAERHQAVVAAGARPVSMRELVVALHASGLRRPKRKGERVLASTRLPDVGPDPGARVDLIASTLPAPVTPARVAVLVFASAWSGGTRPALLVVPDDAGPVGWSLPSVHLAMDDAPVGAGPAGWSLPSVPLAGDDAPDETAARAVSRRTGVPLEAAALRICGHTRILGAQQTWTTYLTTILPRPLLVSDGVLWAGTDIAPAALTATPWWPLVDWLLDRRQPRPAS